MTDTILALLPDWGPWLIALTTLAACLLLPAPASLLLIAAGAFVASGDLGLTPVAVAAFGGFFIGDQIAFFAGRGAEGWLARRQGRSARLVDRSRRFLHQRGSLAVFLSRWLFSPLGPWVTVAAGAAGYSHLAFTLASSTGAVIWICIYLGLGVAFGSNISAATDLAGSALGLIAALVVALLLGAALFRRLRERREGRDRVTQKAPQD
ncbi:DedA family protein [Paracoccus sp. SCSIO 75233]|uniref:DedA family protein n=1 Tax=Paracoccus sp. SCSIO 75233 TaxID=3017782 RepID=UPI0022F08F7B|nr:VTT domain-containing protein [Paracoccus sp. SCSIO 75233]WBU54688.1 VTT domain-containing protein [Paracoccus sp. SCSIO 75233]